MLIEASRLRDALMVAFGLHALLPSFNVGYPDRSHMHLRIGLHVGGVLLDGDDLYGANVNLAARLKDLARPGETACSSQVRDELIDQVDASFEDLGECHLKHIRTPVRAYRVCDAGRAARPSGRVAQGTLPPDRRELRPTIAVLPLEVMTDTRKALAVGNLITDALITAASKGAHLRVISRLSTGPLRGRELSIADVGALLGASFALSGRVVESRSHLTVFAELAETRTGDVVWAGTSKCTVAEVLSGAGEAILSIAGSVCTAILQRELRRVRTLEFPNLEAYSLLLAAISLMHRFSQADFHRARECLETLGERVPRHAEPFAWLARWHVLRAAQGWSDDPTKEIRRALEICRRARDLDPDSSFALTVEGSIKVRLDRDLDGAMQLYRQALVVNPNEPLAQLLLGTAHTFKGDGASAVEHTELALGLTPLDPLRFFYDGHGAGAQLTAGNLPRAIELAKRSLRANRLHNSTLRILAIAQSLAGDLIEARETVAQLRIQEPDLTVRRFLDQSPGGAFAHAHRFADALAEAGLPLGSKSRPTMRSVTQ